MRANRGRNAATGVRGVVEFRADDQTEII